MTAPDVVELGRRAVRAKGWRWVPGMLTLDAMRITCGEWAVSDGPYRGVVDPPDSGSADGWSRGWSTAHAESQEWEPDLTDAATLGALLGLVREAWGDASIVSRCRARLGDDGKMTAGPWDCVSQSEHVSIGIHGTVADTEIGALVAALEAAPVRS